MPNIKSAKKRIRQQNLINDKQASQKSTLRTAVKRAEQALENKNADQAKTLMQEAVRRLDKAVSKGLLHKNAANRHKSRLMKKLNELAS